MTIGILQIFVSYPLTVQVLNQRAESALCSVPLFRYVQLLIAVLWLILVRTHGILSHRELDILAVYNTFYRFILIENNAIKIENQ